MTLSVIGAGWGRTGTMSLKLALEQLGFGPCHHMIEVIRTPGQPDLWSRAFDGDAAARDEALEGFRSSVDWPSAAFWAELAERHPEAKVILSVRDPDKWFDSTQATIFHEETTPKADGGFGAPQGFAALIAKITEKGFAGRKNDPATAISAFKAHNDAVRAAIAPERLLVYEVSEGWAPLCAFLGVPVPDAPFPKANTTEEFVARREAMRAGAMPTH
jgi:hypothetical protein